MTPADSALSFWWLACAGLSCLFLTSTVILVIVLVRRSRRSE